MSTSHYVSLTTQLEEWFDRPFADLPDTLRRRIEGDSFLRSWDALAPDQRRSVAQQRDCLHDPARNDEREREWNEANSELEQADWNKTKSEGESLRRTNFGLKDAPFRLVRAYKKRQVGNGRKILERLLSDERMRTTWVELKHRMKQLGYGDDSNHWMRVWRSIAVAKLKSKSAGRLRKRRSDERDDYEELARDFARLAKRVDEPNSPMNVLVYDLLPREVLAALHVDNFCDLGNLERDEIATDLLPCWPSAAEILDGLSRRAARLAEDAMTNPRPDERSSGNVPARVFVFHLAGDFCSRFGSPLHGSLAAIANVALELPGDGLSRGDVAGYLAKRG